MCATVGQLLEMDRISPMPLEGFREMLLWWEDYFGVGGGLLAICPGCMCVTSDLGKEHTEHPESEADSPRAANR